MFYSSYKLIVKVLAAAHLKKPWTGPRVPLCDIPSSFNKTPCFIRNVVHQAPRPFKSIQLFINQKLNKTMIFASVVEIEERGGAK